MGIMEEIQEQLHETSEKTPSVSRYSGDDASLDRQIAWNQLSLFYVKNIHHCWWEQIPLGQTVAKLSGFTLAHSLIVDYLGQLFKIESLPKFELVDSSLIDISVYAFSDWLSLAQQLGLMMLSVPISVEIDGRVKKSFTDAFGPFASALQAYSSVESFKIFYSATTFRHLRLIADQPPEQLLREASFQAWAMLSLALPKGITQRVHLTIDPDWVAEIQGLRNRFSAHEDVVRLTESLLPTIAAQLRLKN